MEFLSKNVEETAEIATNFVNSFNELVSAKSFGEATATVVGLYGELGSGKTTFMKYLAQALGVRETIQSPTFVIMKKYDLAVKPENTKFSKAAERVSLVENFVFSGFQKLIHIDAYRIEKPEEMLNLGWQEIIEDSKNLICIEWPERISEIMPPHTKIFFDHGDNENERKIKIEK